jgi:hypothetical protein
VVLSLSKDRMRGSTDLNASSSPGKRSEAKRGPGIHAGTMLHS